MLLASASAVARRFNVGRSCSPWRFWAPRPRPGGESRCLPDREPWRATAMADAEQLEGSRSMGEPVGEGEWFVVGGSELNRPMQPGRCTAPPTLHHTTPTAPAPPPQIHPVLLPQELLHCTISPTYTCTTTPVHRLPRKTPLNRVVVIHATLPELLPSTNAR